MYVLNIIIPNIALHNIKMLSNVDSHPTAFPSLLSLLEGL